MAQYMEASQSMLASVHSDGWHSGEEEQRPTGGSGGQRLDDVVIVKVGRSVKSVYDEDQEGGVLEQDSHDEAEASSAMEYRGMEATEQCGGGTDVGGDGEGMCEASLTALSELDTTERPGQIDAEETLLEHEYYDHYFNMTNTVDPDDEYYSEYDDGFYHPPK